MRVALCSTIVPFVDGGARSIVEWLERTLSEVGHDVERVYLPEADTPELVYRQMMAFRWVDLAAADRIVCFRPQSHLIPHPNKVLWFIHHIRGYYDLWDSPYRWFPDDERHRAIRAAVHAADTQALAEAKSIFSNSAVVSRRLREFNGIESEVLYPPVFEPERFSFRGLNDEIVYVSRIEEPKRQLLLVEALAHARTPVTIRLCGTSPGEEYSSAIHRRIEELGLGDRVLFDKRWVSEKEKAERLADCLAAVYIPIDEDSYGYPTLEAAHSSKPVLTVADAGGVLEFVQDGVNGLVVEPDAAALGAAMDRLFDDRAATVTMGRAAAARVDVLGISWHRVVEKLLA